MYHNELSSYDKNVIRQNYECPVGENEYKRNKLGNKPPTIKMCIGRNLFQILQLFAFNYMEFLDSLVFICIQVVKFSENLQEELVVSEKFTAFI